MFPISPKAAWARRAALAAAMVAALGAAGEARDRRPPREVFVGVDAAGVIEAWLAAGLGGPTGSRSRARFRAGAGGALLHCAPGESLNVTVGGHRGGVARYDGAPAYDCPPGHALAARASGELICAPYLAPYARGAGAGAGLAAELLTGAEAGLALLGQCRAGGGALWPAFFAPETAPSAVGDGPCPGRGSTASIGGVVVAGGCAR
jgi:hypothetical protein